MLSLPGSVLLFSDGMKESLIVNPMTLVLWPTHVLPCGCLAHCSEDYTFLVGPKTKLVTGRCWTDTAQLVKAVKGTLDPTEVILLAAMSTDKKESDECDLYGELANRK